MAKMCDAQFNYLHDVVVWGYGTGDLTMLPTEIPDFIDIVMEQIEIGIDRVAHRKHGIPPGDTELAEATRSMVSVSYPEHIELMLNVDAKIDDGTAEGAFENQSLWVKIPWPKKVG